MAPLAAQCYNCAPHHKVQAHHMMPSQQFGGNCNVHSNNQYMMSSYPSANYNHQQHYNQAYGQMQPHMSHSRSLEHYNEHHSMMSHRHSFDNQQQGSCSAGHHYQMPPSAHGYEPTYDCLDGLSVDGSSASYAAVAGAGGAASGGAINNCTAYTHPYNAPGNRYPLPYNISNQLNSHYSIPNNSNMNGSSSSLRNATNNDHYATIAGKNYNAHFGGALPPAPSHHTYSNSAYHHPIVSPSNPSPLPANDFKKYHQHSYPPDYQEPALIDFNDQAPLTSHDYHAKMHHAQHNSFDQYDCRRASIKANMNANMPIGNQSTFYVPAAKSKEQLVYQQQQQQLQAALQANIAGFSGGNEEHVYTKPVPRGHRTKAATNISSNANNDKYLRSAPVSN